MIGAGFGLGRSFPLVRPGKYRESGLAFPACDVFMSCRPADPSNKTNNSASRGRVLPRPPCTSPSTVRRGRVVSSSSGELHTTMSIAASNSSAVASASMRLGPTVSRSTTTAVAAVQRAPQKARVSTRVAAGGGGARRGPVRSVSGRAASSTSRGLRIVAQFGQDNSAGVIDAGPLDVRALIPSTSQCI